MRGAAPPIFASGGVGLTVAHNSSKLIRIATYRCTKMTTYPERICPTCGKPFTPHHARQRYDTDYCRVKANRKKHKEMGLSPSALDMLELIRQADSEVALRVERVAKKAAFDLAEEYVTVCYLAMQRGADRKVSALLKMANRRVLKGGHK